VDADKTYAELGVPGPAPCPPWCAGSHPGSITGPRREAVIFYRASAVGGGALVKRLAPAPESPACAPTSAGILLPRDSARAGPTPPRSRPCLVTPPSTPRPGTFVPGQPRTPPSSTASSATSRPLTSPLPLSGLLGLPPLWGGQGVPAVLGAGAAAAASMRNLRVTIMCPVSRPLEADWICNHAYRIKIES